MGCGAPKPSPSTRASPAAANAAALRSSAVLLLEPHAHLLDQRVLALARDRRLDPNRHLRDVLAQLSGDAALLVRSADQRVDHGDAVEAGDEALDRGDPRAGDVELGAGRQLEVDEELALDQLGNELGAEPRHDQERRARTPPWWRG